MLTVEDYARIRRASRDGMSVRAIARTFRHSRRKVREALCEPEPRPYTRAKEPPAPKLDAFKARIDEILTSDEEAPRKQRHTASQVFRRLAAEGYTGGYDQVRRYVARKRRRERETFIPLVHEPGQRAEADFGHIYVDYPDGRHQTPALLVTWAYSYYPFVLALPSERIEAILHGLAAAFEFFGCVPRELWWDNPTTVAIEVLKGRERRVNERYQALASHYNFEPLFCMPARGNEKPHVENRVKHLERQWATPVPRVNDRTELNAYLRACCLAEQQRIATGRTETIGARFAQDRAAALALPSRAFDPCLLQPAQVDKYQTVRFDSVRYSVPRRWAFATVSVKAYVDRVVVVADGQVVAEHARSYEHGGQVLDPLHYLATLGRKPACFDHTSVYRNWSLSPAFDQLRAALETRHGPPAGRRHYVRVLQLLAEHSAARLAEAITWCLAGEHVTTEAVARRAAWLRDRTAFACSAEDTATNQPVVSVPLPDLSRFDQLLSLGEPCDVPAHAPVVEGQLAAVAVADDVGRM